MLTFSKNTPKESLTSTSMDSFICKRCGFEASKKYTLLCHLQRKKTCPPLKKDLDVLSLIDELTKRNLPDKTYDCDKCDKKFSTRSGKSHHMKICTVIKADDQQQIQTLQETVLLMQQELEKLKQQTGNTTNNTNNGTINNINIQIRNFGHENMDALPLSTVRESFMNNLDFKTMFQSLYCDNDFPENHNIKLKSKKDKQLLLYKDNRWNVLPYSTGLQEVFNRLSTELRRFVHLYRQDAIEDCGEEEFEELYELLHAVVHKVEQTRVKKFRKELHKDILCCLEEQTLTVI